MKILIIGHARTGSTTIAKWISYSLNYRCIYEPLNPKSFVKYNPSDTINDIVVKELYNHFKDEDEVRTLISGFDKVICLTRDNELEVRISMLYGIKHENFLWDKAYELTDEWLEKNEKEILSKVFEITETQNKIKSIPNSLQITYEGVFIDRVDINRIKEYLNIKTDRHDHLLDTKLRYRNRKKDII